MRYIPAGDFAGTDSFSYTVGDGYGGTASAIVTVSVGDPLTRIFVPLISK